MKKTILLITLSALILALTSCMSLSPNVYSRPVSYPSEFSPWPNSDKDLVDYAKFNGDLSLINFSEIVFMPISSENVSFDSIDRDPDEERDEDSDEIAQEYLDAIDTIYWESIQKLGEYLPVPVSWEKKAGSGNALVMEMDVLVINPGSQAARYWASFGAGATELKMEGRLIDPSTDAVLLNFIASDRGLGGSFGGDSYELLVENMQELIIERIGSLIATATSLKE